MTQTSPKEAMLALQEFAQLVDDVVSELDSTISHMQSLESELGGEEQKMLKFSDYVAKEASRSTKNGEEFREEKLAELAANSEDMERTVEKVNEDLENEISEIKSLGEDISELQEMSQVAEEALELLQNN